MDGHVRTQLNAYNNCYENFQVMIGYPLFPTFGIELNTLNPTRIYGFEAQLQAEFCSWSAFANLGWMRSFLGQFFATDPRIPSFLPCDPATGPASVNCTDLAGRDQTYAPNLTNEHYVSAINSGLRFAGAPRQYGIRVIKFF